MNEEVKSEELNELDTIDAELVAASAHGTPDDPIADDAEADDAALRSSGLHDSRIWGVAIFITWLAMMIALTAAVHFRGE
jgi:hypothetical protein